MVRVGDVYGKWTVLKVVSKNSKHALVKCECGTVKDVNHRNLLRGSSTKCGKGICHSSANNALVGKTFGSLLVEGYANSRQTGNGGILWECVCVCGKRIAARGSSLLQGRTNSCGCMTSANLSLGIRHVDATIPIRKQLYNGYKNGARHRKYEFSLSFEEFCNFIDKPCSYCGVVGLLTATKIFKDDSKIIVKYNGIDRVDNTQGYILNNCVTACSNCNIAKKGMTINEWHNWIDTIISFQLSQKVI